MEAVPVDPYSYNDADDKIAFSIRDLRKIAGISDVREEWVWLWSSENKRLFTHLSIKDGKRQGLQDHIALARHYGIKAIKDKDYHGYVTFFKDPNKTTEILTYGDNFSNLDSEIQRAIVNKIFIGEPLAFTDIQLEWPGGEWKEYEFKPMTEVEAYEKILSIWKFADELEFEKIAKDPLSVYKKKRDFDETKEPEGKAEKENKYRFVIQLHKAKKAKDHFDLRLENDKGAMSSWAIPKHKMPKDKEKLLAISTEDHPISYMKFEGKIPEGSYGAGEVEIYDSGKYEEIEKTKSKIVFKLNGKKEKGTYTLLNTDGNKWIIFKSKE
jgi:bifunctional non-homologous end joining protein LigD